MRIDVQPAIGPVAADIAVEDQAVERDEALRSAGFDTATTLVVTTVAVALVSLLAVMSGLS